MNNPKLNGEPDSVTPCWLQRSVRCWRIYNNGDIVKHEMVPSDVDEWVEYQAKWRPGTAIIVDGVVKQCGYLSEERCREYATQMEAPNVKADLQTPGE